MSSSEEVEQLRVQLVDALREKMTLLDQLATVRVSVCFRCQGELAEMEENLRRTLERRSTRLNALRERVVRASDALLSEQRHLQRTEQQLMELQHSTAKVTRALQQEEGLLEDAKKNLEALQRERTAVVAKRNQELQRLQGVRAEAGVAQAISSDAQVGHDLRLGRTTVAAMRAELKELNNAKESLDTEIFTIHEYLRVKTDELERAKEALEKIRFKEEDVAKDKSEQMQINERLRQKLGSAEEELQAMRQQLCALRDEKSCIVDAMVEEREALEATKQQEELTKEDTRRQQEAFTAAQQENMVAKRQLQEALLEHRRCCEQHTKLSLALSHAKSELEDSQRLLEKSRQQQQESLETFHALKCKMLQEFSEHRRKLREMQEERRRLSRELSRATLLPTNQVGSDYRVKEICDTLVGGIERIAPRESVKPVVDHIRNDFAAYLKKHSLAGEESNFKEVSNKAALQQDLQEKAAYKVELQEENDKLEKELREVKRRNEELHRMKEKGRLELGHVEHEIATLHRTIQELREQREKLAAAAEQEKAQLEQQEPKRSSLQDLFKGATEGVKDPYPDLRK